MLIAQLPSSRIIHISTQVTSKSLTLAFLSYLSAELQHIKTNQWSVVRGSNLIKHGTGKSDRRNEVGF